MSCIWCVHTKKSFCPAHEACLDLSALPTMHQSQVVMSRASYVPILLIYPGPCVFTVWCLLLVPMLQHHIYVLVLSYNGYYVSFILGNTLKFIRMQCCGHVILHHNKLLLINKLAIALTLTLFNHAKPLTMIKSACVCAACILYPQFHHCPNAVFSFMTNLTVSLLIV